MGDYSGRFGILDGSGRKRVNTTGYVGLKMLLRSNFSMFIRGGGRKICEKIAPDYGGFFLTTEALRIVHSNYCSNSALRFRSVLQGSLVVCLEICEVQT